MGCASSQEEPPEQFDLPISLQPSAQTSLQLKQKQKQQQKLLDILKHPQLSLLFKEYLRSVLCVEAYCFYMEVEEFKEIENFQERITSAHQIFNKYFRPDSEYEIHVEGTLVAMLKESLDRPDREMFDLVQQLILVTIQGSCLPNFLTWELYESFINDPLTRKAFLRKMNRTRSYEQIVKYTDKMKNRDQQSLTT